MLNPRFKPILIALAAASISTAAAQTAPVAPATIRAKSDSTVVVMGDRVGVEVQVVKNSHSGMLLNPLEKNADYFGMEFLDMTTDSAELGNNRVQLTYHLNFQAFDPAELLTLPPFAYSVEGDTLYSDILTFKVLPVDLSPQLGDPEHPETLKIHPNEGQASIAPKWYDAIVAFFPSWTIWVVLGILAIALGITLYFLYKKNGPALFVPRPKPTPYEIAQQRLEALRRRRLIEAGQTKLYYTELIDIMRSYLEGRFGINALEMPSKQILQRLRENKETHLSTAQMEQVLQLADFVKFAAANPDPQEGVSAFQTISKFIESTKPQPEPQDKKGKGGQAFETKKKKTNKRRM